MRSFILLGLIVIAESIKPLANHESIFVGIFFMIGFIMDVVEWYCGR